MAFVYAEQHGITRGDAIDLPVVELFGIDFLQMFRTAVLAVGNYGEMFNRTLQEPYGILRQGRNLLNGDGGPQLVPLV